MALTDKQKKIIDGYILFGITLQPSAGNHWRFKTVDWRYGLCSMSPYKASMIISYILNETPTKKQKDIIQSYVDIENFRKLEKGRNFRSELLQILKLRKLLYGNKSFFCNKPSLHEILRLDKADVYDHVKTSLIEYLISLNFSHIPQDFLTSDKMLHSPTIQKKPFAPDFDYNQYIPEELNKKPENITIKELSEIKELSKYTVSYWVPSLLNFTKSFDALYTTFNSAINIVNTSIKISLDIIKEWHNHIHQDILEPEIEQSYISR